MKRQSVRMMVMLVLSNGLLAMLTSAQSPVGWKMTSRNNGQRDSNRVSRLGLNIGRPSWFARRNSGTNRNVNPRTRHRSERARSQMMDPDFTSLFIPENPISSSFDARNSKTNTSSTPDLIVFDNNITRNLVKKDVLTQKIMEMQTESQKPVDFNTSASDISTTSQVLGSKPNTFGQTQINLNNSSQSFTMEQVITRLMEQLMGTSPDPQTPIIASNSVQTDSATNQDSTSTINIIQEQSQNTSVKAENLQQNPVSDNQLLHTLPIINQSQSLIGRLNPVVTQSNPLTGQNNSSNSQSQTVTDHSNIDNSLLHSAVDQKVGSSPDHLVTVKLSPADSQAGQTNQVLLDQSHLSSSSVSQFRVEQSTPVNLDVKIINTSPSDLLLSSKKNQSKTIPNQLKTESQQTQKMAKQSGTKTGHLHEISDRTLSTSMPPQVSSNRLQKDTVQSHDILNQPQANVNKVGTDSQQQTKTVSLQTDSIKRLNPQSNGNVQLVANISKIAKPHLLKIELQEPAGKLRNSLIQIQILNHKESAKDVFSLSQSQHIAHHPVPSNVKTFPHFVLEKTQASVTQPKTPADQSVTVSNKSVTRKTQNGEVPVPVKATTDLSQSGLSQANAHPAQPQGPTNQSSIGQRQMSQPLNDQPSQGRNIDKIQSFNDQLSQSVLTEKPSTKNVPDPRIGQTPLEQKTVNFTHEEVFTFKTQPSIPKEFLNQENKQKINLNQIAQQHVTTANQKQTIVEQKPSNVSNKGFIQSTGDILGKVDPTTEPKLPKKYPRLVLKNSHTSGSGSHLETPSRNDQQVNGDLSTNSPDHKTNAVVNKMPQQTQSSVQLNLNQTASIDNNLIQDKPNLSQVTNPILPANITKEKAQTPTRTMPVLSKQDVINILRKKFYEELCLNYGHYLDGIKYVTLEDNCDSYIRCMFFNEKLTGYKVLKCPYGYFWDNSVAACKEADKVSCPTNPCQNKDTHSYAEPGNCRAYWTCRRKKSSPKCCPGGMSFHPINGCRNDTNCTDSCPQMLTRSSRGKCSKLVDPHLNWLYLEYIPGKGYQCRACPSGTQFNKDMCACTFRAFRPRIHARIQATEDQCRPEIYLNFNHGMKDISGKSIVVGSENVGIHNGHAGFNGQSKITIWRFKDAPIGQHFIIQLRFKRNPKLNAHRLNIKKEHLISNCGRRVVPSIDVVIFPYESSIQFAVQTTNSKLILKGKYNATSWNDIELRYDGKQLKRIINGIVSSQPLSGNVISKPTSMMIGFCSPENGFHGWIDHVKIYFCKSGVESQHTQGKTRNSINRLPKNILDSKARNGKPVHRNTQNQFLVNAL